MTNRKILESILCYLLTNHTVDNTNALLYGASNEDCLFLTHSSYNISSIREKIKGEIISLEAVDTQLKGKTKPLLVDSGALYAILSLAMREIDERDRKIQQVTELLEKLTSDIKQL